MLKDPVDLTKRKPQRLKGTPAWAVVNVIAFTTVSLFAAALTWFTTSEAAWVQRARARMEERMTRTESEVLRKQTFNDPVLGKLVMDITEKLIAKEDNVSADSQLIQKFVDERGPAVYTLPSK